jgi:hypothetical protein
MEHLRVRVVSEAPDLRAFLHDDGFEVRNTLATTGLLLGRPSEGAAVGNPLWVLYESGSVVLRRSPREGDAFLAAAYHLRSADAASGATERLALTARVLVLPTGRVWLTDPYVMSELAGLDRLFERAGVVVLPTTIASVDVRTGEVELPDAASGPDLPAGRFPIERMLYRTVPENTLDGIEHLRLARMVVRSGSTDLARVVRQIAELVDNVAERLQLRDAEEIQREVAALAGRQ